jgi:hypothetical protein
VDGDLADGDADDGWVRGGGGGGGCGGGGGGGPAFCARLSLLLFLAPCLVFHVLLTPLELLALAICMNKKEMRKKKAKQKE